MKGVPGQHGAMVAINVFQYTSVSRGAVLSAHSCPRSLLPRETERSLNFASACRSSREALRLPSPFLSSYPIGSLCYSATNAHLSYSLRCISAALFLFPAVVFIPSLRLSSIVHPPLLRATHRFVPLLPSSHVQFLFPYFFFTES